MRKNTILKYLLVAAVTSCSTPNYVQNNQPITRYNDEVFFPVHLCNDPEIKRNPSAADACVALFADDIRTEDPSYAQKLQEDPLAVAEAEMNKSTDDKYPVKLSSQMKRFRDRFLGFIKNTVIREPLTRSFESAIRMRSLLTENALMKNNYGQYDVVIVGTGVHGIIALHAGLARNPNLKILLVDEGDTAGATFRYGKEVFNINSSNRSSGKDSKPLPGEGNINELPGLPIQVSDLTSVKYPTANDLGTALVSGLYSALRQHPNVEVLFNTKATQILPKSKNKQLKESIALTSSNNPDASLQVDAQAIILTTGLGTPRLVEKVTETLIAKPELARQENGKIPKVIAFEDVIRILGSSNEPAKFFKDKKIAVVGKGDSANVFIEYALGYAAREGYARSSAQGGKVKKIFWIGQEKQDCKDFISDIRSRYQQVSTGFRSSSKNIEAIITPYAAKLSDVKNVGSTVTALLADKNSISDLDFIVVTTGFEQNVRALFSTITNNRNLDFKTDADFFKSQFETLEAPTSISAKNTKVARKLNAREIYVLGTAAGELADPSETVGIIQNYVSIFNNAPRVVAATQNLVGYLQPLASKTFLQAVNVNRAESKPTVLVTDIQESRFMPNQTLAFLEATFKEALSLATNSSGENLSLVMTLKGDDLKITSATLADPTALAQLLAQSREFFSLARELLKFTPGQSLQLTAYTSKGSFVTKTAKVEMTATENERKTTPTAVVNNNQIKLRGLLATEKKRDEKGKPRKDTEGLDLTNRATFQTFGIFNPIKPGKFKYGRRAIEKTIDKPFEMSATLVTQRVWALVLLASGEKSPIRLAPSDNKNDPRQEVLILPNGASLTVRSNHPVEGMNPKKAFEFIDKLNELSNNPDEAIQTLLTNLFPGHRLGDQYDVPTDLQFEYVLRGLGKDNAQYFEKDTEGEALNFSWNKANTTETQAVATLNPRVIDGNPFFDLEGNVRVWVKDPVENPYNQMLAASPNLYYARGSSFSDPVLRNTSDDKYTYSNSVGNYSNVGLRLVRTRRP